MRVKLWGLKGDCANSSRRVCDEKSPILRLRVRLSLFQKKRQTETWPGKTSPTELLELFMESWWAPASVKTVVYIACTSAKTWIAEYFSQIFTYVSRTNKHSGSTHRPWIVAIGILAQKSSSLTRNVVFAANFVLYASFSRCRCSCDHAWSKKAGTDEVFLDPLKISTAIYWLRSTHDIQTMVNFADE